MLGHSGHMFGVMILISISCLDSLGKHYLGQVKVIGQTTEMSSMVVMLMISISHLATVCNQALSQFVVITTNARLKLFYQLITG